MNLAKRNKMELILHRKYWGEDYTIGDLFIDGQYWCNTLEDLVRDRNKDGDLDDPGEQKVYGETCIPFGEYRIILTWSPKFKKILPLLVDVPGFTGIRIHPGNDKGDTLGCILPGENSEKGRVYNSRIWFEKIMTKLHYADVNGEEITITIT